MLRFERDAEVTDYGFRDIGEVVDLVVGKQLNEVPTHRFDVPRGGVLDRPQPGGCRDHVDCARVLGVDLAPHLTPVLHPAELVREPALRPQRPLSQLDLAHPVARRLGRDEHGAVAMPFG